jgi:hypothetical protein
MDIAIAAAIFLVYSVGGLALLRRLRDVRIRGGVFLVLAWVGLVGTLQILRWLNLDPVEGAYAWGAVALVVAVAMIIQGKVRPGEGPAESR